MASVSRYDEVFLALDALDKCPENEESRRTIIDSLARISEKAANLRIFATSREIRDIKESMALLRANVILVSTRLVDTDIGRYVVKILIFVITIQVQMGILLAARAKEAQIY